jgi:ribonuclease III
MSVIAYLKKLGIDCQNGGYIEQAFIHTSFVNENKNAKTDNERLEFMGDAVLQQWVSHQLFLIKPVLAEGQMTTLRAHLVNESSLANYARHLDLARFLKLGVGEEKTGGRDRDSNLANMFEAFLGALFLQCSPDAVDIILQKVITPQLENVNDIKNTDFKTRLQEVIQSDNRKSVVYEVVKMAGPSNKPEFEVVVKLDEIILGRGRGLSKKKAEQEAARNAFDKMVR